MKKLLLTLFAALAPLSASADSFVWKVEKDGNHAFIGGTVHVLRAQDKPLPKVYQETYDKAEVLVFEADTDELQAPSTQQKMLKYGTYQDGSTLESKLRPEVVEKLKAFCEESGIPYVSLQPLKPALASVMISVQLMMRNGAMPEGIDMLYANKAKQDKKQTVALETVDRQFAALFADDVDPNKIILSTIEDAKNIPELLDLMIVGLFNGEVEKFETEMLDKMREVTPMFYQSLVVERNNEWLPKIETMLKTPEVEFILVGALHLVGDVGVIEQLETKGYKVTQLD